MTTRNGTLPAFQYAAELRDSTGQKHCKWWGLDDRPLTIFVRRFADKRLEIHYIPKPPIDNRRDSSQERLDAMKARLLDMAVAAAIEPACTHTPAQVASWIAYMGQERYDLIFGTPEKEQPVLPGPSSWQKYENVQNKDQNPRRGWGGSNPNPSRFIWAQSQEILDTCEAIAHFTAREDQYFVTLTMPGSTAGAVSAYNRHDATIRHRISQFVTQWLEPATGTAWAYVVKAEPQQRGVTHYHVFLADTRVPLARARDIDDEEAMVEAITQEMSAQVTTSWLVNNIHAQRDIFSASSEVERSLNNSGECDIAPTEQEKSERNTQKRRLLCRYATDRSLEAFGDVWQHWYSKLLAYIGKKEGVDMLESVHEDQKGRAWDDIRHYACRVEHVKSNAAGYMAKYMTKGHELLKKGPLPSVGSKRKQSFQAAGLVQEDFPVRWWTRNRVARRLKHDASTVLTARRSVGYEIAGLDEAILEASSRNGLHHMLRLRLYNPGHQVQVCVGTPEQLDALEKEVVPLIEVLTKPAIVDRAAFSWLEPANLLEGQPLGQVQPPPIAAAPIPHRREARTRYVGAEVGWIAEALGEQPPVSSRSTQEQEDQTGWVRSHPPAFPSLPGPVAGSTEGGIRPTEHDGCDY